jgi:thiol-disulfide isomerase/thioredoxin
MDWKLVLRIGAILALLYLLASSVAGCRDSESPIIDWDDCSQSLGDHPCNFSLVDQHGEEFNLYDHHGKIIILDFSAMWCGPCQFAATEIEELQTKYKEDIVYVTILIENLSYNPPTKSDIKSWVTIFEIETAPVLASSRSFLSADPNEGWPISAWPQFYIIDRNMVIVDSFKGSAPGRMEQKIIDLLKQPSE